MVGACCEVAGNPAGMINPSLPVFVREQPGVLLQCQDDYLGGRGGPQIEGKTPHRRRGAEAVLAGGAGSPALAQ